MDGSASWKLEQQDAESSIRRRIISADGSKLRGLIDQRSLRGKVKVMIADDDEFISNLAFRALARQCDVVQTFNGDDTVATYLEQMPNMIFLDIELGDISGLELVRALLQVDPEAHIIMFSGHTYGETVRRAIEEGAKGFIAKPFPTNALIQHVTRYQKSQGFG